MNVFPCIDCGTGTFDEHFMVHDDLWAQAFGGVEGEGDLCILCLEKRLARRLNKDDFPDLLVNDLSLQWTRSGRLIDRLTSDP